MSADARPYPHPAALDEEALLAQCRLGKGRSRGPGGQHRNKVETLVTIMHEPTGIEAHAGERRSVADNKRVALKRLRLHLAVQHRCGVPIGEIGSALWRSRLRPPAQSGAGGRIVCNPDHRDYPSLLAEALDTIADAGWDLSAAALRLNVSMSQLLKLLKDHPPALVWVNAERAGSGKHPLR